MRTSSPQGPCPFDAWRQRVYAQQRKHLELHRKFSTEQISYTTSACTNNVQAFSGIQGRDTAITFGPNPQKEARGRGRAGRKHRI
eukprot:1154199-Pelagomonas_calceolata.AAC.1